MAVINFESYSITKAIYTEVNDFVKPKDNEIHIQSKFDFKIIDNSAESKTVVLWFNVEDSDNLPFRINVEISGEFKYDEGQNNAGSGFDKFRANALAILYPYLRNVVSQLTLLSNKFPSFILPTVNMYAVVKKHDEETSLKK
ncbi:protein-export chaperone SecB [Leuconostoc mesenteroides]|uniref:protein-export chaperone SecB n=1 Tax=Leuconostoc mesenteroides TaxID=1245 RepID=UPI00235F82C7|nr:protein-export chaperone SecB [Leuconostoc mesenteroides]